MIALTMRFQPFAVVVLIAAMAVVSGVRPAHAIERPQGEVLQISIILVVLGVFYAIPSFIAFYRKHPNRWLICVINIVFGGTGIGWLGSLVWACSAVHLSPSGSNGGESGPTCL